MVFSYHVEPSGQRLHPPPEPARKRLILYTVIAGIKYQSFARHASVIENELTGRPSTRTPDQIFVTPAASHSIGSCNTSTAWRLDYLREFLGSWRWLERRCIGAAALRGEARLETHRHEWY